MATVSFALPFAAWGLIGGLASVFAGLYKLTAFQTALLIAVPVLLGSLARLPMGMLTDRFGGRLVFTALLAFSSVAAFVVPLTASYSILLVTPTAQGIASRVLARTAAGNITLFAFDAGEELSEHTAPFDALVVTLSGGLTLTIGGVDVRTVPQTIVLMPANVPQRVHATEPMLASDFSSRRSRIWSLRSWRPCPAHMPMSPAAAAGPFPNAQAHDQSDFRY